MSSLGSSTTPPSRPLAHGPDHLLEDHLWSVATLAARHAPSGSEAWAHLAGLWHDVGKYRIGFQRYVRMDSDAHIEGRGVGKRDKSHSAAGALHALNALQQHQGDVGRRAGWLLAHLIAAHHAGLYDAAELTERLLGSTRTDSEREYREATEACAAHAPALLSVPENLDAKGLLVSIPGLRDREPLSQALWLRMLFSSLVDADFIDTEAWLDRARAEGRKGFPSLPELLRQLDDHLATITEKVRSEGRLDHPVMQARARVLADCRAAASRPPGVFSLQVPTGGGKTLASLAFALRHAVTHGLDRVIVAIPYTSIVEQTADVLADIFGRDNVVEHHSQADSAPERETLRSRLACENWDAPIVVTTNVQLLESMFAARASRCRKLHRIRRSVIILDEAQTLPPPFLQPTLDALRLLVLYYGATIVSCTATQPVLGDIVRFDPMRNLRGLTRAGTAPCEIVGAVQPLYAQLDRVRLRWPADLTAIEPIPTLAARVGQEPAVLAIVNTRRDARDLVSALDGIDIHGEPTLHLSAAMCGQHRADVITEVRHRLDSRRQGDGRPLRLVSTQLVEAGVDIDFPVVFRAMAGLDSIAQAAGRCNREGRLGARGGRVEVFVRPIPVTLASLVRAAQATCSVVGDARPEAIPPDLFRAYFENWYGQFDLDERKILPMLHPDVAFHLKLRSAANAYRLIDDEDQVAVVVPYTPRDGSDERTRHALEALKAGNAERWHLRLLQRFVVQARRRDLASSLARGDFLEPLPGWYLLRDEHRYSARFGLLGEEAVLDPAVLVQ